MTFLNLQPVKDSDRTSHRSGVSVGVSACEQPWGGSGIVCGLGRTARRGACSWLTGVGRLIMVFGLITSLGWHRGVLQSVAWVGMVVQYSQDGSMAEALEMTFDGQHPCRLCLTLRDHQSSDQDSKAQRVPGVLKLDPAHPWQAFEFEFPPTVTGVPGGLFLAQARLEPPPTPPPRGIFGW